MNARLRPAWIAVFGLGLLVGCAKPVATPAPKPVAIPQRAEPPKPMPVAEDIGERREKELGSLYRDAKEAEDAASKEADRLHPPNLDPATFDPKAEAERGKRFFHVYEAMMLEQIAAVAKRHDVSTETVEDVLVEGDRRQWFVPPDKRRKKPLTEAEVRGSIESARAIRKASRNPR
jgi:hypothetical protein